MAVYQGTRPVGLLGPRVAGPAPRPVDVALPRRRTRAASRVGRRRVPVGAMIGGIALVFVLAFFSLAQAVRVSASNYEVDRLAIQRDRMEARQRELISDLNRLGSEPAIRK